MLQHGHCALYLFPTLNAFALTGRQCYGNPYPQGVASLALGWALLGFAYALSAAPQQFKQA